MRVLSIAALLVGLAAGCGPSVDVGLLWISITDAGATVMGSLPVK